MASQRTRYQAPPDEDTIRKQRDALEMRRAGASYTEIAHRIGYADRAGAHKAVRSAIANAIGRETAQEVRDLEADRLDRLQIAVWKQALQGDLKAVDRVLAIMQRRARLLGLDHADGLAERAQALDEMQAAMLANAINKVLDAAHLTPEQQVIVGQVLPRELAAISAAEGGA